MDYPLWDLAMGGGLLMDLAAFTFFGSYERLREGVRKPFLIHSHLFSNGLLVRDVPRLNESGIVAHSGWAATASAAGGADTA